MTRISDQNTKNMRITLVLMQLALLTSCMPLSDNSYDHITGDYYLGWIDDDLKRNVVNGFTDDNPSAAGWVLKPQIVSVGHNEKFIIAKQHPLFGEFPNERVDESVTNYFIIECRQENKVERVFGPLAKNRFDFLLDSLDLKSIEFSINYPVEK